MKRNVITHAASCRFVVILLVLSACTESPFGENEISAVNRQISSTADRELEHANLRQERAESERIDAAIANLPEVQRKELERIAVNQLEPFYQEVYNVGPDHPQYHLVEIILRFEMRKAFRDYANPHEQ